MAIDINLWYTFKKDKNSTKIPITPIRGDYFFQCTLKDGCSVTNPEIIINANNELEIYKCTYARIPKFNRYYFISDWRNVGKLWIASLTVDVLASYREEIGNSYQFVTRCSKEFEGTIIDTKYPMKTRPNYTVVEEETIGGLSFVSRLDAGFFVVGIFNNDVDGVGTVTYYGFTNEQFRSFCNLLMNNDFILSMGVDELSSELLKALFNPLQYIASCIWVPLTTMPDGDITSIIPFGYWAIKTNCKRLTKLTRTGTISFKSIPHHPQSLRGYYLRTSPFSRYKMVIPAFGTFEIPSEWLYDSTQDNGVICTLNIDLISGEGIMEISTYNSIAAKYITQQTHSVQVCKNIALSQRTINILQSGLEAIGGVAGLLTGNVVGGVDGIASAISGVLAPTLSTRNSNQGGIGIYAEKAVLICEFHEISDEFNDRLGRPLCAERKISDLGKDETQAGYIICANAELDLNCYESEHDKIIEALESGIYYE